MLQLRNVTFMTADPNRLADFWQAALELAERKESSEEVLLAHSDWRFPRFTFQRTNEGQHHPSAVHIDLSAEDRVADVSRLVALGATERKTHGNEAFRWTVLLDPDGNEFCVTD